MVFPARVVGGEMGTDVTEGGGSEQGINDCVDDSVGVRVTGEAGVKGDGNAAQNEGTVGSEGVNVVAEADTYAHKCCPRRNVSARRMSCWVVILILVYAPGKMVTS